MQRIDPRQKSGGDVRRMFDAIAPRYDLLNRLLSAGIDARWRRRAVATALAGLEGRGRADVADICCGTGDLGLEFSRDPRVRRGPARSGCPAHGVRWTADTAIIRVTGDKSKSYAG